MRYQPCRAAFARPEKITLLPALPFIIAPLALLTSMATAAAPVLPGAGTFSNQLRQEAQLPPAPPSEAPLVIPPANAGHQAPAGDSHATVVVSKVVFTGRPPGLKGLDENALQARIADFLNHPQTFSGLESMAQRITDLYRQHGYLVARAVLPPQTVKEGVLTIQIQPGLYDEPLVHNATGLKTAVVQRLVRTTTPAGEVVTRRQLEREALLLGDIPGVTAQVSLAPGRQPGTTQPQVTLTPGKQYGGYVGMDNQGDPSTGRSRVMAGFYANSLLGQGDQLRVDLLDAWEKSDLFNGSLDYSALVGGYGTRVGVNYSHLNYQYSLAGMGFEGYSDNWGVYVTHPWIRTAGARVDIRFDAGQQFLTDKYPQAFADAFVTGRDGHKQVNTGALSLRGSVASVPGGVSAFTLQGTVGNMDYRNAAARAFGGTGTSGQFSRFSYLLNHTQQVWGPLSFYAGLNGQMTNQNLDSSQKFLMGGPSAVRAYDIGDGAVDEGNVATAEVRSQWGIPYAGLGSDPTLTLAAFYDQGWGEQYRDNYNPATGGRLTNSDNRFTLAGGGLYATVADAGNYSLTLTWARRTGDADPVSGHDDHNRFWVSAVKTF
ncbi:ShlB/FhaC/HecB family hemolysin secretion/activation protein [Salmonella enterica subsp. enterica serovar Ball]|nr:ShlB/FhaC/HecB family hemolysin secretion/activation protein [Salmonella enterica subsp. salamae]EDV5024284.1 ShlB/FhaC/HecB family hemolysin secretion/activation protein [Salmonella enterica subsp. enterica serovar Ball]